MPSKKGQTGTRDSTYNLVSALYHVLQGAETSEQYLKDAEKSGDQELVQFFRDWKDEQVQFAERAKNLLGAQLGRASGAAAGGSAARAGSAGAGSTATVDAEAAFARGRGKDAGAQTTRSVKSGGNAEDDRVDEQAKETFPASDSPAY